MDHSLITIKKSHSENRVLGRYLFLLFFLTFISVPAQTDALTYYVSPNGNEANTGTSIDAPLKKIVTAMFRAVPGDTIYLRGGTYREAIELTAGSGGAPNNLIKVWAYPGETPVLKATDIVTGWMPHTGSIWKKENWTYDSQQVFVDFDANPGPPLRQLGTPEPYARIGNPYHYVNPDRFRTCPTDMIAGSFCYDRNSATLYVWLNDSSNPNDHIMDVGTRARNLFVHAPRGYFHIKGLSFRFGNGTNSSVFSSSVYAGLNSILEDLDVQWADFTGVSLGPNSLLINSYISNNGNTGVGVNGGPVTIRGNRLFGNNYRLFNPGWHAGAMKLVVGFTGIVENNEVWGTYGQGIWVDGADSGLPIIIRNNYVHDNNYGSAGIFFEISNNGLIHNNIVLNNDERGIYISTSAQAHVFNNTVAKVDRYTMIDLEGNPTRIPAVLQDNRVMNNIVGHIGPNNISNQELQIQREGGNVLNNRADHNLYYRPSGNPKLSIGYGFVYNTLTSWQQNTGHDTHGLFADPRFVSIGIPKTPQDVQLSELSPAIDAGTDVGLTHDFFGNLIYGKPDIGAVEYQPPYQMGDHRPDTAGNIRIYANGRFRNTSQPSGTTADLFIGPVNGFSNNTYAEWMNVSILEWGMSGNRIKRWSESSGTIGSSPVSHRVGDLAPNMLYSVSVDGVVDSKISGNACTDGVCRSDVDGKIHFVYSGGYSTRIFLISPVPAQNEPPPRPPPPPPPPPSTDELTVTCSVNSSSTFVGTTVTFTATGAGGNGAYFYSWTGSDGLYGTGPSIQKTYTSPGTKNATINLFSGTQFTSAQCTINIVSVPPAPQPTYSYPSTPELITITILIDAPVPNAGTVTGLGISCPGDCIETTTTGTNLALTAKPNPGYTFTGWSVGNCPEGARSCSATIIGSRTITATFKAKTGMGATSTPLTSSEITVSNRPIVTIFNQSLYFGIRGPSVVNLQRVLIAEKLMDDDLATGYFGKITLGAVQNFQKRYDIVHGGTPSTTGFGLVGPKTRAQLNELVRTVHTELFSVPQNPN